MVIYGWTLNDIAQQKTLNGFFDAAGKHLHIWKAIRAQKKPGFCLMIQPIDDLSFSKIAKVVRMARIFPSRCGLHYSTSFYWFPAVYPFWRVVMHHMASFLPLFPKEMWKN